MTFKSILKHRILRSKLFIPTLRESPREAEIKSHQFLLRAGFIRRSSASGIYMMLPLMIRSLSKLEALIDVEMNTIGASKLSMPLMLSSDLWKETGRWDSTGSELIRLKDRHKQEFCLGPTHEEIFTDLVKNSVNSWKDLPLSLYQTGKKYRDELRPRFGLFRSREFIMKDCYSFHLSAEDAERYYFEVVNAYSRIFNQLECSWVRVQADSGNIGGNLSHEFHIESNVGEDRLFICNSCDYASNAEKASSSSSSNSSNKIAFSLLEISNHINDDDNTNYPLIFMLKPADRKLNLIKLRYHLNNNSSSSTIIRKQTNGVSMGEVNEIVDNKLISNLLNSHKPDLERDNIHILIDESIYNSWNNNVSNNDNNKKISPISSLSHTKIVKNIRESIDYAEETHKYNNNNSNRLIFEYIKTHCDGDGTSECDLYSIVDAVVPYEGDNCPCEGCEGLLREKAGIEVGHVFYLGTKYSQVLKATIRNNKNKLIPMEMGCYGIGVSRVIAAIVETNCDDKGIKWPKIIAPYVMCITSVGRKKDAESLLKTTENLYDQLNDNTALEGEIVLDDRSKTAFGVKITESELIGYPYIVIAGKKALEVPAPEKDSVDVGLESEFEPIFEVYERKTGKKVLLTQTTLVQRVTDCEDVANIQLIRDSDELI